MGQNSDEDNETCVVVEGKNQVDIVVVAGLFPFVVAVDNREAYSHEVVVVDIHQDNQAERHQDPYDEGHNLAIGGKKYKISQKVMNGMFYAICLFKQATRHATIGFTILQS